MSHIYLKSTHLILNGTLIVTAIKQQCGYSITGVDIEHCTKVQSVIGRHCGHCITKIKQAFSSPVSTDAK